MQSTSKVAKHKFYNLFQNLKMSPIRSIDDLPVVPAIAGAFILWLDEAPPRCLYVGIASPKLEDGLRERLTNLIFPESSGSELEKYISQDTKLGREYKTNLKNTDSRKEFIHNHIYFQYLTIPDLKDDELHSFEEFLISESDLNPRYHNNNIPRPKRKR